MSNENEASVQEDTLGLAMAAALVEPPTESDEAAAEGVAEFRALAEGDVVIQTDEQMNP